MLKKGLFFVIATALPLVIALLMTRLTLNIFPSAQIAKDPNVMMKAFFTLFSPGAIAVIIPVILFWLGPYWTTELVNWSGCFNMLYMGFILLITKMIGVYGIGIGIIMIIGASSVVAMRLEEGRWRGCVVGAYKDD